MNLRRFCNLIENESENWKWWGDHERMKSLPLRTHTHWASERAVSLSKMKMMLYFFSSATRSFSISVLLLATWIFFLFLWRCSVSLCFGVFYFHSLIDFVACSPFRTAYLLAYDTSNGIATYRWSGFCFNAKSKYPYSIRIDIGAVCVNVNGTAE